MRIISGELKGKTLISPDNNEIRPTSDRGKEVIFDTLSSILYKQDKEYKEIDIIDIFCGTGSLGIEAISRGSKNIFFIDKNSINKKGDKIFFIKMHEYSDFNDYGEKSSIIHHEVDCKNLKFKYLTDFYFKLPMGEGEPSFVGNEESDWIEVKDDTILKVLVSYVCN